MNLKSLIIEELEKPWYHVTYPKPAYSLLDQHLKYPTPDIDLQYHRVRVGNKHFSGWGQHTQNFKDLDFSVHHDNGDYEKNKVRTMLRKRRNTFKPLNFHFFNQPRTFIMHFTDGNKQFAYINDHTQTNGTSSLHHENGSRLHSYEINTDPQRVNNFLNQFS